MGSSGEWQKFLIAARDGRWDERGDFHQGLVKGLAISISTPAEATMILYPLTQVCRKYHTNFYANLNLTLSLKLVKLESNSFSVIIGLPNLLPPELYKSHYHRDSSRKLDLNYWLILFATEITAAQPMSHLSDPATLLPAWGMGISC